MKITKLLRFLLIATAMVMVFSLFACTETPEEVTTEGTEESVESSEDKGNTPDDPEPPIDGSSDAETDPKEETSSETEAKPECQHEAVVDAAVAPTCEDTGLTEGSHCGLCNEVIVAQEPVAALGHAWNDGEITTAPTCEGEGSKLFTCANDDTHTKTEPVAALGHAWNDGEITTAPTCEGEGSKLFTCANDDTHTKTEPVPALGHVAGEADVANGCKVACTVCEAEIGAKHAADKIATAWTPIAEKTEDGVLQEAQVCSDCGQPAIIRPVAYKNNLDGIKINGVTVNPGNAGNALQTNGLGGKTSDYWVYDIEGKMFDGDGNAMVVTDSISIFGWFACNGSATNYVFKVNDGEWKLAPGVTAGIPSDNPDHAHVKAIESANLGIADYYNNVIYAGTLSANGLQEYANQKITVTIGAVPANNPGTEEEPNVITMIVIQNVFVTCDHTTSTIEPVVDPTNPQKVLSECSVCGFKGEAYPTVTDEGLLLYGPEILANKAGSNKATIVTDENGMKYVSLKAINPAGAEENFSLFGSTTPITNIGGYVAILYRSSITQQLEVVCESVAAGVQRGPQGFGVTTTGNAWTFKIMKLNTHSSFDGKNLTALRLDHFNAARTADDTTDIAFLAFFASEEAAIEYYAKYLDAFADSLTCPHFSDNNWVVVEETEDDLFIGTHCLACGEALGKKACDHPSDKIGDLVPVDGEFGSYNATCSICGYVAKLTDVNQEGLKVIKGDELLSRIEDNKASSNIKDKVTITSETDENGLSYVHVEATTATGGDGYLYFNNSGKGNIMNVDSYVVIVYRTNNADSGQQAFISNGVVDGSLNVYSPAWDSTGEWAMLVLDFSSKTAFNPDKGVAAFRWDIFDKGGAAGEYVDIAYVGFFSNADSANSYYADFCENYGV